MTKSLLTCKQLTKTYSEQQALSGLDIELYPGEILAVVGPSGCGKTTLLRLIAGFEIPDAGVIALDGKRISGEGEHIPAERRGVGMVFQDYALFPHMRVAENIAFGLEKWKRSDRTARTQEMLSLVGLEGLGTRFPHELSGGERQRVALARALAPAPPVILLDEPFSNLDAERRLQMRVEVRRILKEVGTAAIFVTHDQEEALYMGDRLALLRAGKLEQVGTPEEVFHEPATRFVAEFMGQADFLQGRVVPGGIQTGMGLFPQETHFPLGSQVELALRGDDVDFHPVDQGCAVIEERIFLGAMNRYRLRLPSGEVVHSFQPHTRLLPRGMRVDPLPAAGHDLAVFIS